VDRLIHERASAIEGPSAAPVCGVVISLIAIPFHISGSGGEDSEAAFIGGLFKGIHAGVEAAVEDGGEGFSVRLRCFDQLIDPRQRDFERFFDDGVFPRFEGSESGVEVGPAGGCYRDDFEFGVREKLLEIRVALSAVFSREFISGSLVSVENRVESASGHRGDGFGVKLADHAGADDSEFHKSGGEVEPLNTREAKSNFSFSRRCNFWVTEGRSHKALSGKDKEGRGISTAQRSKARCELGSFQESSCC